jgi:hypothetical protein
MRLGGICAHIQFRDKTDILRTLVDIAPDFTDEQKGEFKKSLRALGEYAKTRNMVVHSPFVPDQTNLARADEVIE